MRLCLRVLHLPLLGLLPLVLTGCSMSANAPATPEQGVAIQGRVMGGQSPLVGAQLYLLQANTTGYAGPGIAASTSNASKSLLTSLGSNTVLDTSGSGSPTNGFYYVASDSTGAFSITNDYTCTPGAQVYLYSLGGGNSGAGLLAALGSCPGGGTFSSSLFILINEVSTIATA